MTKNFPIGAVLDRVGADVDFIALYVGSGQPSQRYKRWLPLELLDVWLNQDEHTILQKYQDKIIVIDTSPIGTTDFSISDDEKEYLVRKGRAAALRHLFRLKAKRGKAESDFPTEAEVLHAESAVHEPLSRVRKRRSRRRFFSLLKVSMAMALLPLLFFLFQVPELLDRQPQTVIETAFTSYRGPVKYHVSLHDSPSARSRFLVEGSSSQYLFYQATVDYVRYPAWPSEYLLVAAITDPSSYAGWVRAKDVVYREIIGLEAADARLLPALEAEIRNARTSAEKQQILSKLVRIAFFVDGREVPLNAFSREPFGFVLQFENPAFKVGARHARYVFEVESFQPRTLKMFPFIASELFRDLDYRLDYSDASIRSVDLFSAFLFDPSNEVVVSHDPESHVLTATSSAPRWVYPGGGIALTWDY